MSERAAIADQVVAVATVETPRGPAAAVAAQQAPSAAAVAEQGPAGPRGPPGIAAALVVRQTAPSASWVIRHGLGRYPHVQVFDATGEQVYPDVICSPEAVSIVFARASTGTAILF